jgi:membrane protein implicated in regulation of membrane protease activity
MDFLGAGWIWLYIGAGLMLAEILTPGFVMFFFGLSAATVGVLVLFLPDTFHLTMMWQLALFSFFSLVYLVTLRRYVKNVFWGDNGTSRALTDEFTGRLGEVTKDLPPDLPGRVVVGDAEWDATAAVPIVAGTRVKVLSRRNLTLTVEAV